MNICFPAKLDKMGKSELMRQQRSKSHTSALNTLDFERVYTDKKAKTLCAIHTCKVVQKLIRPSTNDTLAM